MKLNFIYNLVLSFCLFAVASQAQPINDNCATATPIPTPESWCGTGLSNVGATPSQYSAPICSDKDQGDVWFTFKAIYTQVKIKVTGKTMKQPMVALYVSKDAQCGNLLFEYVCNYDVDLDNITDLVATGLAQNDQVLIRIYGEDGSKGTFDACVKNYGSQFNPSAAYSDYEKAFALCDKSDLKFSNSGGIGNKSTEANELLCFSSSISTVSKKKNRAQWLKFQCEKPGKLTFNITPNNIVSDDIDFAIFKLADGPNTNLTDFSKPLRCMGGGSTFGGTCTGVTGLRETENDFDTDPSCPFGKNNFLAALDMEKGAWYALYINSNLTFGGDLATAYKGFTIDFGGNGTFACYQGTNPTNDFSVFNKLKLYPNPTATHSFTIEGELMNPNDSKIQLKLFNALGQTVFQTNLDTNNANIQQTIELPLSIENGFYFLDISNGVGRSVQKLILK